MAATTTVAEAELEVLEAILQAGAGAVGVDLDGARIGDAGATQVADMLRENATVTVMDPGKKQVGDDGVRALRTRRWR
jgi:hypothetical protein